MKFNKSIYAQHGKELNEEVKKYKAHGEKTTIEKKDCKHKSATISDGTLVCRCGAVWMGAGLDRLYKALQVN